MTGATDSAFIWFDAVNECATPSRYEPRNQSPSVTVFHGLIPRLYALHYRFVLRYVEKYRD